MLKGTKFCRTIIATERVTRNTPAKGRRCAVIAITINAIFVVLSLSCPRWFESDRSATDRIIITHVKYRSRRSRARKRLSPSSVVMIDRKRQAPRILIGTINVPYNRYNSVWHLITRSADSPRPTNEYSPSRSPTTARLPACLSIMCFQLPRGASQSALRLVSLLVLARARKPGRRTSKVLAKTRSRRLCQFYPSASCEAARFFLLVYFSLGEFLTNAEKWIRERSQSVPSGTHGYRFGISSTSFDDH